MKLKEHIKDGEKWRPMTRADYLKLPRGAEPDKVYLLTAVPRDGSIHWGEFDDLLWEVMSRNEPISGREGVSIYKNKAQRDAVLSYLDGVMELLERA